MGNAPRNQPGKLGRHSVRIYRGVLLVFVVGVLTYLFPAQRPHDIVDLPVGSVTTERINAPIVFYVRKSDEDMEAERAEAQKGVPTVLRLDHEVRQAQLARFDSSFQFMVVNFKMEMEDSLKIKRVRRILSNIIDPSFSNGSLQKYIEILSADSSAYIRQLEEACRQLLINAYSAGIISTIEKNAILFDITTQVRVEGDIKDIASIPSHASLVSEKLLNQIGGYSIITERDATNAVHELLSLFLRPNLAIDTQETRRLREEAQRGVAKIKRRYLTDEMIIDSNTLVTKEHVEALNALAAELRKQKDPLAHYLQWAGAAVVAAFVTILFGLYLAEREPETYRLPWHLLLLALLCVSTAAMASYIQTNEIDPFLVPTPLAAMLATILLSPQIGLVLSLFLALFVGSLFGDFTVALICGLTGAVAVYSVRHVRHRNQFYRAMIFLPLSYALLIGATDALRFVSADKIYEHILPGIFIGVASPILTIGLLPIFESLFHLTTDITLLELSDLNRPLLRELAIRAPGTYTHSLIMANLSETAAEAIGANPLLARVGCYYHDIGKMLKSEYFVENQGLGDGKNPHDHLTPTMSTLIITSHVKDGLELAEQHGLPKAICDLIPQHHGTTVLEIFYNRAIELGLENVRKDDFRYDGPKPQTKEAGILMLADSVESAARTLPEKTHNQVRRLVRQITHSKFSSGELDECALTLQDLHHIEQRFIPVLMGTLHGRVEYPWQKAERERGKEVGNPLPTRNS